MATIPAYSIRLWQLEPGYAIPGPQVSGAVPFGMVWVVRDISAYNAGTGTGPHGIPSITLEAAAFPIWSTPHNGTSSSTVYELFDRRVVLNAGEGLAINTDDPNWFLLVSGFQLTA